MNVRRTLSLIPLLIVSILTGCGNGDSQLIGKWQNENLPETVQFMKNKTGVFEVRDNPSLPFKWSLEDGNRIRLEFVVGGASKTLQGTIVKDEFFLRNAGQQAVYRKIK